MVVSVLMRVVIPIFCLLLVFPKNGYSQPPIPKNGQLNATSWDFNQASLSLRGEWLWYDFELLAPQDTRLAAGKPIDFPKIWNDIRPYGDGQGFATYTLTVLLPDAQERYTLEIPQLYSSYRLWVNDDLVAENGKVGQTPETSTPQWKPQTASFVASKKTEIVLQISNFHHFKGGAKDPIFLGKTSLIEPRISLAITSVHIQFLIMLLVTTIAIIIFFGYQKKKVTLFFALLCFTWAVRSIVSNRYILIQYFPDFSWDWMVRIEYFTLYFTMIWAILYIARLFKDEVNQFIKYGLIALVVSFVAVTLISQPVLFTRWLNVYLAVSGIILFYAAMVVVKALINDRIGSGFLTVSLFLGILIFTYDIFAYEGFFAYTDLIFSGGYTLLFTMMGFGLLVHLKILKSKARPTNKLTYSDLYKDDD
jgi:hypothetical protein